MYVNKYIADCLGIPGSNSGVNMNQFGTTQAQVGCKLGAMLGPSWLKLSARWLQVG